MSKENVEKNIERLKKIHACKSNAELAKKLQISRAAINSWIKTENIPKKYIKTIEMSSAYKEMTEREVIIENIKKNVEILNEKDLYETLIFTSGKIRKYLEEKNKAEN